MPLLLKNRSKLDYRAAVVMGLVVATIAFFGFFTVQRSYVTPSGCQAAGGRIDKSKCQFDQLELEIKPS